MPVAFRHKRIVLCILLFLLLGFSAQANTVDLVVLLDVSQSMFPHFQDTVDYLLSDIIQEHLRTGDSFHLISFSDFPEREIQQAIRSPDDIKPVLARIGLLLPLGNHTDLILALRYLYQYTHDLGLRSRKNIVILTDGIHNPPPGSMYPIETDEDLQRNIETIKDLTSRIRREGWNLNLVEYPQSQSENEESVRNGQNIYDAISDSIDVPRIGYQKNDTISHEATGAPRLAFPEHVIRGRQQLDIPFRVSNFQNKTILVRLDRIMYEGRNILTGPVHKRIGAERTKTLRARVNLPDMEKGRHNLPLELFFTDNLRIFPRKGIVSYQYSVLTFTWVPYLFLLAAILLLLFMLIRFVVLPIRTSISTAAERGQYERTLMQQMEDKKSSQVTVMNVPGSGFGEAHKGKIGLMSLDIHKKNSDKIPLLSHNVNKPFGGKIPLSSLSTNTAELLSNKEVQHYPIEMRVLGQNPLVGNRNIHWIGQKKHSIGGKGSDFYIFLYSVPYHIAEIHFKVGKGFIFTPLREDLFPELDGKPLEDCLHRQILLENSKGDDMILIFHEWVSPLERINRILRQTKESGV